MPNSFKSSYTLLGTTGDTTLYTTPVNTTSILRSVYIAHSLTSSAAPQIDISVGATGVTSTAYLIRNATIPYGTTLQIITEPVVLEAQERIFARSTTGGNALNVTLSWMEIT
jgi:hypothetical protein